MGKRAWAVGQADCTVAAVLGRDGLSRGHGAEGTVVGTLHQALLTKTKWNTEGAGMSQKQASLGIGERAVR